jgi:hypothetical protein
MGKQSLEKRQEGEGGKGEQDQTEEESGKNGRRIESSDLLEYRFVRKAHQRQLSRLDD